MSHYSFILKTIKFHRILYKIQWKNVQQREREILLILWIYNFKRKNKKIQNNRRAQNIIQKFYQEIYTAAYT